MELFRNLKNFTIFFKSILLINLILKKRKLRLLKSTSNFGSLRLKLIIIEEKWDLKYFSKSQVLLLIILKLENRIFFKVFKKLKILVKF